MRSSLPPRLIDEQPAHPFQVLFGVYSHRTIVAHPDVDRDAVKESAQLLEALGSLQRRLGKAGELLQRRGSEAVEPDVRQGGTLRRAARVRDQRPREIQRASAGVTDHL